MNKKVIDKGWSSDKKYCITSTEGTKYLLRISSFEKYDKRHHEFEMMKRVEKEGVPMCKPIEFGRCDEGVYVIQSWIDGIDAEEIIQSLPEHQQYQYGYESGEILKRIHTISAPDTHNNWEEKFNRKIDHKIQLYKNCPIKYENGELFVEYLNNNRHLLKNRPQSYQHGDYHIGNMMIDQERKLQIIDFDRDDYGDPWEEFNRIVWCAQVSEMFARGMVDGYFKNEIPMEFWELLALYISSNTIASIPWAIPFGEGEVQTMLNQAKEVLSWYDNMNNVIPNWYRGR